MDMSWPTKAIYHKQKVENVTSILFTMLSQRVFQEQHLFLLETQPLSEVGEISSSLFSLSTPFWVSVIITVSIGNRKICGQCQFWVSGRGVVQKWWSGSHSRDKWASQAKSLWCQLFEYMRGNRAVATCPVSLLNVYSRYGRSSSSSWW